MKIDDVLWVIIGWLLSITIPLTYHTVRFLFTIRQKLRMNQKMIHQAHEIANQKLTDSQEIIHDILLKNKH